MSVTSSTDQLTDAGQAVVDLKNMPSTGTWQGISCIIAATLVGNDNLEYEVNHPLEICPTKDDDQSGVIFLDNWSFVIRV